MVSKSKLYTQLDLREEEMRERLVPHLENAASGRNKWVFCTTEFNLSPQLPCVINAETDALVQLGRQVLQLREKLGESSAGTIAERICWYCRKWSDSGDNHQKAAQELARDFLQELAKAHSPEGGGGR